MDSAVERNYRNYIRSIADHTAHLVRQIQRRGEATQLDADGTALALCLMTELYIFEKAVDGRASDLEIVVDTLKRIWERVVS